ncbi:gephyrin-like molybdotransferase Glp [Nesterenkonia sphaerica]|uniref:Molybdopterin molybdenumtransferase n=1 Tax=Nesterenkonia sphaerica TaxID=1804988 RepID=A0A5R9AL74_9MICC|nr:gephyrin-like molybdotransferase Glp [Nesterenkonia sphaerica]TLP78894.1 molybdopterin molybdotransferase MoeA [Nesterenkonia sphaerica]
MADQSTSSTSSAAERVSLEVHIARLREILGPALANRRSETLQLHPQVPQGAHSQGCAAGRVSAAAVTAPVALPGFDNSQMDGFAVRLTDVPEAARPFSLPLGGVAPAGAAAGELPAGQCMAVMTGAPIPAGAEAVIPVEQTTEGFAVLNALRCGDEVSVHFTETAAEQVHAGRFIRQRGSDVAAGETLLREQQVLTPAALGLLAACGISQVEVVERVRTLVVATGQELRQPGDPLRTGELYDANTPLVAAVCHGFGHTVHTATVASDEPDEFQSAFQDLLARHRPHLVITAGGISAGAFEVVRQALSAQGVRFGAVAQQPGGPQGWGLLLGSAGPAAMVALPGNPVSCAVSLETLLRPALASLDPGCPPQRRIWTTVGEPLSSPAGTRQFRRVELSTGDDGTPTALPVGGPSSHLLGHLARAQALLELREDDTDVPAGTRREAILL